ncbi:MAG: PD40 domain-containing protein [Cyclobacteriaceae bacterium]
MNRLIAGIVGIVFLCLSGCSSMSSINKQKELGENNLIISKYAATIDKNDPEINYHVAEAFRTSNRIHESERYYAAAQKGGVIEQDIHFYYARALKANEKYDEARTVLQTNVPKIRDKRIREMMENEIKNLSTLDDLHNKETYFRAKNLEGLNTPNAEYAPVHFNNFLYFTSNREGGKVYKNTGTPFTDLYRVNTKGANVDIRTLKALDPVINEAIVNEGSMTISANGNSIIFAKGNTGKATGNNDVNLFFTRFRNGQWSSPRPVSINDPNSWDSTPALSPDGTTLYFASTRPGGFGGADLYSAKLNRRGRWVDVRNLGPDINTSGNEMFPHVSAGGELYFSSDHHPGFGNLDIFKATRNRGLISIENLGQPMNSNADDFAYYEFNATRGFFSSNRKGGKGDDDIYTFINDDPDLKIINYYLVGTTVTDNDGGEEIIVSNSKVTLISETGDILDESFTGEDGRFRVRVYPEENYDIKGEKTEYFTTRKEFSTIGKSVNKETLTEFITNVEFETKIHLDRIIIEKPIVLNNIYYDLNKAEIRSDAALVLDSLVMIMDDNPDIYIELGSHTDSRDTEAYNMELSWRRARSAVSYIISKGVESNRITAKGYGESQLLIKEAQNEEEHQVNRRTEFKVLRYNPRQRVDELAPEEELDEYERFFSDDDGGD